MKEYTIGKWTKDTFAICKDKTGAIIRHYICVKRKKDNAFGLYDLVAKKFYEQKDFHKIYVEGSYIAFANNDYIDTKIILGKEVEEDD